MLKLDERFLFFYFLRAGWSAVSLKYRLWASGCWVTSLLMLPHVCRCHPSPLLTLAQHDNPAYLLSLLVLPFKLRSVVRSKGKLQALVYDILPALEEGTGKRCSECGVVRTFVLCCEHHQHDCGHLRKVEEGLRDPFVTLSQHCVDEHDDVGFNVPGCQADIRDQCRRTKQYSLVYNFRRPSFVLRFV